MGAGFWCLCGGELILAHETQGAFEVLGDILPGGAGGNAAFGAALGGVIFPAADITNIFHHHNLPNSWCIAYYAPKTGIIPQKRKKYGFDL